MADPPILPTRFVAVALRKHDAVVGAVAADQQVTLPPCVVELAELEVWLRQQLRPSDTVVLAARANLWQLHDTLAPMVGAVTIAHPQLANLLPNIFTSSDPREVLKLARLLAGGLVPAIWVPPPEVRDLRALSAYRRRLILQHSEASNQLQTVLRRHGLVPPGGHRLGADRPGWWAAQTLAPNERGAVRDSLAALNRAANLLAELEERLQQHSAEAYWQARVGQLMNLAGMRRALAIVLLATIGNIERFPTANQLASYAGLAGDQRADSRAAEEIADTKEGRREIRATMLDVAEGAIRIDPHWGEVFERLQQRIGSQRAIVAVARKLLVVVWRMLTAPAIEAEVGGNPSIRIAA
jgi:transposase